MNSLLKRQIRKHLTEDLKTNKDLVPFLDAVAWSYTNYDEQLVMLQRAMTISSEELFNANQQLRSEAKAQKEVINKLKHVIETLKFYNLPQHQDTSVIDLDGLKLVDFIDNQTKEILEINKQREALLEELAYQNQELSDYAHMVSHDLKSPLRNIDTLTTWLVEDNRERLDKQSNKQLDLLRANVEKMDALINGILQYSTIAKSEIELYEVDLNNLIDEIKTAIQLTGKNKIIVDDLPNIYGDKSRLTQLFQNLIVNAIKYNDKEQALVEIGVKDKNKFWEFYVRDNGIGIEEKYHNKIFNTFEKLENSVDSTGIGLAIVKKIVEVYGGEIWITSKVNEGTTFFFTLLKKQDGSA
jgi:light-regulated signal transduction histidine kinase (bacteriophytochrome)